MYMQCHALPLMKESQITYTTNRHTHHHMVPYLPGTIYDLVYQNDIITREGHYTNSPPL